MLPDHLRDAVATLWAHHRIDDDLRPADVLVGLGSHDRGVAEHAADLHHRGLAPLVVFTGAATARTSDVFPRGEAVHYREIARARGVPEAAILVEPHATNTAENLTLTRALLADRGLHPASAILVSRPYQQRRVRATAAVAWPEVVVRCTALPQSLDEHVAAVGDVDRVVTMLVGDTHRVIEYPRRGFAAAEDVPAAVRSAFATLVDAGYTGRLLPQPEPEATGEM
jgi:uncharacterized SAM-binding protein YcdF (DUF218 family)